MIAVKYMSSGYVRLDIPGSSAHDRPRPTFLHIAHNKCMSLFWFFFFFHLITTGHCIGTANRGRIIEYEYRRIQESSQGTTRRAAGEAHH